MIWFILAGIFAVSFIVYCIVDAIKEDGWQSVGFRGVVFYLFGISFISACAACVLMVFSSAVCAAFAEVDYTITETREIAALNDNASTSGRFFLGAGGADEEMKYYFVEETDKGKRVDDIPARNAYVIESNDETPRIERYSPEFKSKWLRWIAFTMKNDEYRIYIPENSVTTDFSVDLE